MTGKDYRYLRSLVLGGYIQSPCLEMGVGLEGANSKALLCEHGVEYYGTDKVSGSVVDFVIDFDAPIESIREELASVGEFGSVVMANVLEHTFDPIRVLDHAIGLLRRGGTCAVLTPAVWPLHDFPVDCWRIMPSFFTEYAKRRDLTLLSETFQYLGHGPVAMYRDRDGALEFPRPGWSRTHHAYSRVVHRLFNTFGRGMFFPVHLAVGVVLQNSKPDSLLCIC